MIEPMPGKVLIEVIKQETIGGTKIIIPDASREKELGRGICRSGEYEGRTVYFTRYSGDEVEDNGKTYVIIDEDYLIAIVDE